MKKAISQEERVDQILEDAMWEGYEKINQKKEGTGKHLPFISCPKPVITISWCPECYKILERQIISYYKGSSEFEQAASEWCRDQGWKEVK